MTKKPHPHAGRAPVNKNLRLPPTLLQPEEIEALFDTLGDEPRDIRLRVLLTTLYRTGIVIGEALALNLEDVDLEAGTLWAHGTKWAERQLGLDPPTVEALAAWIKCRDELGIRGKVLICTFAANAGNRLDDMEARHELRRLALRAGLADTRVHPLGLRHTCAAELLGELWPYPYVQAQLGITTLTGLEKMLGYLGIPLPADAEVRPVARARPLPRYLTP
jgi:integrase/recombinase XerD